MVGKELFRVIGLLTFNLFSRMENYDFSLHRKQVHSA